MLQNFIADRTRISNKSNHEEAHNKVLGTQLLYSQYMSHQSVINNKQNLDLNSYWFVLPKAANLVISISSNY